MRPSRLANLPLVCAFAVAFLGGCASDRRSTPAAESSSPGLPNGGELGPLLAGTFARAGIPGGAAVVLRGDRIVARGVAGVRKAGTDAAITADDQFEICSCAKSMTATLLARYVDRGLISWDTAVADALKESISQIDPAWKTVTLRQLMEHRAGLSDHFFLLARMADDRNAAPSEARRALVARLLAGPPDSAPGRTFKYESAGYLVLGVITERLGGKPWETLMREQLFAPLNLTSAGFGPPGTPGTLDQPWGHGPRWLFYLPIPGTSMPHDPAASDADFPGAAAPAGLVHMSIDDWAKFVTLHLRGDLSNPHHAAAMLTPETFALLHHAGAPGEYTGGWFTGTRSWAKGSRPGDTGRVFYHQGDNTRWNSAVYVAPEIDFAVLVICNRGGMWKPIDEVTGQLAHTYAVQ